MEQFIGSIKTGIRHRHQERMRSFSLVVTDNQVVVATISQSKVGFFTRRPCKAGSQFFFTAE